MDDYYPQRYEDLNQLHEGINKILNRFMQRKQEYEAKKDYARADIYMQTHMELLAVIKQMRKQIQKHIAKMEGEGTHETETIGN